MAVNKQATAFYYRRLILISLGLVGIAVLVFAVVIWIATRQRPEIPPIPPVAPIVVEIVSRATSSAESTHKWVYTEEQTAYAVSGTLESDLQPEGNSLRGTMTIDGDLNESPVVFVIESDRGDGLFSLGRHRGEFGEGQMEASLQPLDRIRQSIKRGDPIELRFMYYPMVTPTAEQQRAMALLESLLQDEWEIPSGIILRPTGIGIIE